MATVTLLKFKEASGADEAFRRVQELQKQHLLKLHDAALISWPPDAKRPASRQLTELVKAGSMGERFWGQFFGEVFAPFFGADFGALGASFRDFGIGEAFIEQVRAKVTEGTSALVLMTSEAVFDRVVEEMKRLDFEIIATSVSDEQLQKLRDAFGPPAAPGTIPHGQRRMTSQEGSP